MENDLEVTLSRSELESLARAAYQSALGHVAESGSLTPDEEDHIIKTRMNSSIEEDVNVFFERGLR